MEINYSKYKEYIFSRYFILKEGLFKNTKKMLNIYKDCLLIENVDESEREIISFEDIINILFVDSNNKDFKINYKTNKNVENTLCFSSINRTQVICDILRQIDLFSKINKHPVESFKCSMFFDDYESIIYKNKELNTNTICDHIDSVDVTINIYRSIIEFIPSNSNREIRIRISDIESIKVYDGRIIKFETFNKIDINIFPKVLSTCKVIVEILLENCQTFIDYEVNVEYISNIKEISQKFINMQPKSKLFSFSGIDRILYNNTTRATKIAADYDNLYEIYENEDNIITKTNKISINEICYIIMYESNEDFFEVVTKNNARYLYQVNNHDRNVIITHLIDLVSNKHESNCLILSSKPQFGIKISGFVNDEVDWEYEKQLFINLFSNFSDSTLREKIIEDICLNFCFHSVKFQQEPIVNKKIYQLIYELIPEEFSKIENMIKSRNESLNNQKINYSKEIINHGYKINLYLILCKSLILKSHYDKVISDLLNYLENSLEVPQTIFYNSISIFKVLILRKNQGLLKKDEIAQRKWMIASHFDNGVKIKKLLFSKIFELGIHHANHDINRKIIDFERINTLAIYILIELQKEVYEFSKDLNIMTEIVMEFNQFDFLYILYILIRGNSNIIIQKSIEILIILLKNLSIQEEYNLKNLIISRTLIFFVLLNIYLKSGNEIINMLAARFLKSFLISHVEATTLILNLFPMTIFYYIDKKPNPINWLDHEWDNFFLIILKDQNTTQVIWNQSCKNELYDFINKIIEAYETFTEDHSMAHAFHLDDSEKDIPSYNQFSVSAYLNINSNTTPFTLAYEQNYKPILKSSINCSFYCLNYKEIKMEYITLKKHVFVWQYYLKRIINENGRPNLSHPIDKPKKLWKKLMHEITVSSNENKLILIIKTLTLLYKFYYEIVGIFKEYDYFLRLFSSTKSVDIKIMIIQMFLVTVELEEKEIKEPNLKNLIDLKAPEFFINFIPELISNAYLRESIEKSFTFESILSTNKNIKASASFLDNKIHFIKNMMPDDVHFDKKFANYTNYMHIDESWNDADNNIKTCTLIIRLFKLLLKRFSIIDEKIHKINFPLPKIKHICYDLKNYKIILSLLFSENENLVIETLDLILNFINDPLTHKQTAHKTNLLDVLVFYMFKFRCKSIMKFIDNIHYYHNLFFNFEFMNDILNEHETEFLIQYPNANKFLLRYLPINLIYYYLKTDFVDFIKILMMDNVRTDLIWNTEMFNDLITQLKNSFINNLEDGLVFKPEFKVKYDSLANRRICYLYFLDIYIQDSISVNIDSSHVKTVMRFLLKKLNERLSELNTEKEVFDEELLIYLKTLNKLIITNGMTLGEITESITKILNMIIDKENSSPNENIILAGILASIYASVNNVKPNTFYENAINEIHLLNKSLIFLMKKYFYIGENVSLNNDDCLNLKLESIKIISAMIDLIKKQPDILDKEEALKVLNIDSLSDLMHKIIYSEIISKIFSAAEPGKIVVNSSTVKNYKPIDHDIINIIMLFLDLLNQYSLNPISTIAIIANSLLLELILFSLLYKIIPRQNSEFLNIAAFKSMTVLLRIIQYTDGDKKYKSYGVLKDAYDALINIFDKQIIGNYDKNDHSIDDSSFSVNDLYIKKVLIKIKTDIENPKLIWNKNLRKELKTIILSLLSNIHESSEFSNDYINKLKNFRYVYCQNELNVNGIYISIYNKDPTWLIFDADNFLIKAKESFLSCVNLENISDLLLAISNVIKYSKSNDNLILDDDKFILKFDRILKIVLMKIETAKVENEIKFSQSDFHIFKDKILSAGMNLLLTLSEKSSSLRFLIDPNTYFIILNIIDNTFDKDSLEYSIKILRNIFKFQEFIEKINLSIFLFLLKKLILLKEIVTKQNKESTIALRVDLLKIIKKFILNEKVGFAIKGLYEFYLPLKIIDNLILGKDVTDQNLVWVDSELELPDLIWNSDAMNQSKKLLIDDCNYILNDNKNLENFPHNLLTHKLDPHKTFFFEINDEFKIDNIYIRIFNKDPSYNIGKNLIVFLKHVIKIKIDSFKAFTVINFYIDNMSTSNKIMQTRLPELLKQKLNACLTCMCMIIEQINFNDFNENLGISSIDEMKNLISQEEEKNLLSLVQRSFDFPKLLSTNIIKKILTISNVLFGIEDKLYNNFTHFDNNIRLIYLQIVYLMSLNKHGLNLISGTLNVLDILEKMFNNQDKIVEFVVALCIFTKIISNDISHISGFLTRLFEKFVDLTNKRSQLLKYLQLIFCKIINDTHYGDSLVNTIKQDPVRYKNFPISISQKLGYYESQVSQIWRKGPDSKEQSNIIYKTNHHSNFVDDNIIKSFGSYQNFEGRFPFLPKQSISYLNINDIDQEEINSISKTCFAFTKNLELVAQLKETL